MTLSREDCFTCSAGALVGFFQLCRSGLGHALFLSLHPKAESLGGSKERVKRLGQRIREDSSAL